MQPQRLQSRRQRVSSRTCELCKIRHQKCSKERPTCHYCQIRHVHCVYRNIPPKEATLSTTPSATSFSDTETSVTVSSTTNESGGDGDAVSESAIASPSIISFRDLPALHSTLSTNKVSMHGITEAVSNSSVPIQAVELGSCKEVSTDFLLDTLTSHCADKSNEGKRAMLEEDELTGSDPARVPFVTISVHKSLISLDEQLPAKTIAKGWLTTFLGGPNLVFRICNEAESRELLDSIYANGHISSASKCSIWLQLAAGCRLTAGAASKSYATLYESGCRYLEWCVEQADEVAPLWAVPPMLLNCLCTMGSKPKTCWFTLGAAIRLAQKHNLDREWESHGSLSPEEYERWREVWRSMISFDAWLSVTLGKSPQISQSTTQDLFVKMTLQELARPDDSIEVNMAKLSVLISRFLASLCRRHWSASTQESFFYTLETWVSQLPRNLQYSANAGEALSAQAYEAGPLYLEIFYFAMVMTLTKPEFFASLCTEREQDSPHRRFYSQACVDASAQIAHLGSIMLDRGFLCQGDWCVTTLTYHAGLVLALSLKVPRMSLRYSLQLDKRARPEQQGLETSTNILSACAPHNPLARRFYAVLNHYHQLLETGGEVGATGTYQTDDHKLSTTNNPWPPTPLSAGDSTTVTTNSTHSSWLISSEGLSTAFSCSQPVSNDVAATMNTPFNNSLTPQTAINYSQRPVSNPAWGDWATTSLSCGSNYPDIESILQSSPYFKHYCFRSTFAQA